jgi:hypothetical protein
MGSMPAVSNFSLRIFCFSFAHFCTDVWSSFHFNILRPLLARNNCQDYHVMVL